MNSAQNPISALHSFEKILKASDVQMEFEAITTINCDRVQRRRLQAIHKESRILCVMHFSSNHEMAESSQVIRDAIVHTPLCKFDFMIHDSRFLHQLRNIFDI